MRVNSNLLALSSKLSETQLVLTSVLSTGSELSLRDLEKKISELMATFAVLHFQKDIDLENAQNLATIIVPAIYEEITGQPRIQFKTPEQNRSLFKVV